MADKKRKNTLKSIRTKEGLTQVQLANKSNVSVSMIGKIENQMHQPSDVIKNKIVIGLNKERIRAREYLVSELFD